MGTEISYEQLPSDESLISRLIVYYNLVAKIDRPVSIGKKLAEELLICKPERRSMKLEQIFNKVIDQYPDGIIVDDIDVLFNPAYKVDILKLLIEARKRKRYSVIWPGRCENGKLIFSEEGFEDYKVYNIDDYDITCVIGGYRQ